MQEIEYYLEANGLLMNSQVSSKNPTPVVERPKSYSEQRQVPTFMSQSEYQQDKYNNLDDGYIAQAPRGGKQRPVQVTQEQTENPAMYEEDEDEKYVPDNYENDGFEINEDDMTEQRNAIKEKH